MDPLPESLRLSPGMTTVACTALSVSSNQSRHTPIPPLQGRVAPQAPGGVYLTLRRRNIVGLGGHRLKPRDPTRPR
ncbi:hypothetical protein CHELA40_15387 [Chelatococcus asaccharovorans]|nr:hypothetical protein CHELA17_60229 [Chelatococcus asaccharovorans]CAH1682362.1 hypothetical protein CHELA40_15387 [Chelatococcus asaccharovorans]